MILQADATKLPLADKSVDLVFGSPPYCDARTYGIGADRGCAAWVQWMLKVTRECLRVSRGPVVWVAAGVTRDRTYWPACEGLMWLWWMSGGSMYRPCYWHRVGIPGSGGDQWFRADVEYVMCFKRPGPLPWTDNTACGHRPKWAPGGEMSHRLRDGQIVNQWGPIGSKRSGGARRKNGGLQESGRPSHRMCSVSRRKNGVSKAEESNKRYPLPAIANPGTLISTNVGGGSMGHGLSHENEAPFPEKLAEFFVLSLCPPGGTVLDPFAGSYTTCAVAERYGRKWIGSDIRMSQCELGRRRMASVQKSLFV